MCGTRWCGSRIVVTARTVWGREQNQWLGTSQAWGLHLECSLGGAPVGSSGEPKGTAACKPHSLVGREVCQDHQSWTCCFEFEGTAPYLRWPQSSTEGVGPQGLLTQILGCRMDSSPPNCVTTLSNPGLLLAGKSLLAGNPSRLSGAKNALVLGGLSVN